MEKNAKRAETERKRQMKNVCCLQRRKILGPRLINDRNTLSYDRSRTAPVNKPGGPSEFTLTNPKNSQLGFNEVRT